MFDKVLKGGKLENVSLLGMLENTGNDNEYNCLLVGNNDGTIENCTTNGSVYTTNGYKGSAFVANNSGVIRNCTNNAFVISKDSFSFTPVAGLCRSNFGSIEHSINNGNVIGNSMDVAGVVGINNAGALMKDCENNGDIETVNCTEWAAERVGGVASSSYGILYACMNRGKISGSVNTECYEIGGVAGELSSFVAMIKYVNYGEISGNGLLGGVVGETSLISGTFDENDQFITSDGGLLITACSNYGNISSKNEQVNRACASGGVVGSKPTPFDSGVLVMHNCTNSGTLIYDGEEIEITDENRGTIEGSVTKLQNRTLALNCGEEVNLADSESEIVAIASDNPEVCSTEYKFKLTAKGNGTCNIYVVFKTGLIDVLQVTVTGVENDPCEFTDLCYENGIGWVYKIDGEIAVSYVGLVENEYGTWFVNGGKVAFGFYDLVEYEGKWWNVVDGKVDFDYTGLV